MQNPPVQVETDTNKRTTSLAERMDPSIGEASSVMGTVMTELLRRTLRGGVQRIGDELQVFVEEKVDATIAERTPAIEQAATEVAQNAARVAATEVAYEEVKALEKRTQEGDQHLAAKIAETAQTAERITNDATRTLSGRIEFVQKKAEEITATKAQELSSQIQEAEKRVTELAKTEVQDLLQRSRESTAILKTRLTTLEGSAAEMRKDHDGLRQELAGVQRDLTSSIEQHLAKLRQEIGQLRDINQGLNARLAELEKPRGLFSRLFRRNKKTEATPERESDAPEAPEAGAE